MLIKDANNQTWIVKFKFNKNEMQRNIRFFKCPAKIVWTEMSTVCSVRKVEEDISKNISVEIRCKKSDIFKKYVGRQIAFVEMMDKLNLSENNKEAFVSAYNNKFRHKIQIITDLCKGEENQGITSVEQLEE